MPSPFSFLYSEDITVQQVTKPTGLGDKQPLEPITIKGRLIRQSTLIRSSTGEQIELSGKLHYDHTLYHLQKGDIVISDDGKRVIEHFSEAGGLPGIPARRVAMLKWLV